MDLLFYLGSALLGIGVITLGFYSAYRIGKKQGAKEYYNLLSSPREESEIQ